MIKSAGAFNQRGIKFSAKVMNIALAASLLRRIHHRMPSIKLPRRRNITYLR